MEYIRQNGKTIQKDLQRLSIMQSKHSEAYRLMKKSTRYELSSEEVKKVEDYDKMCTSEYESIQVGDRVAYLCDDGKVYLGQVIEKLDYEDIRTDTDGVRCAGAYVKYNEN